jgi:hypothetical protein
VAWFVAGGVSYSANVAFFLLDSQTKFSHSIWHLFVMAVQPAISPPLRGIHKAFTALMPFARIVWKQDRKQDIRALHKLEGVTAGLDGMPVTQGPAV